MNQVQAVIDAGLIPPLITIMISADDRTKTEACRAISNASSTGQYRQIDYLVEAEVIPPLSELLHYRDMNMVSIALTGLENIFQAGQLERQYLDGFKNVTASNLSCHCQ